MLIPCNHSSNPFTARLFPQIGGSHTLQYILGEAIGLRITSGDGSPYPIASPLHHEQNFPFMTIPNAGCHGGDDKTRAACPLQREDRQPLRFPQISKLLPILSIMAIPCNHCSHFWCVKRPSFVVAGNTGAPFRGTGSALLISFFREPFSILMDICRSLSAPLTGIFDNAPFNFPLRLSFFKLCVPAS